MNDLRTNNNPGPEDSANSPDRIVRTAVRLFSERGYDGTSVAAIAEASGVNKALIYYYFEDKQGLYREVLDTTLGEILKIWRKDEVATGTPPQRLTAYLRAVSELIAENVEFASIFLSEFVRDGELRHYAVTNYFFPNALNIAEIIELGADEGYFRTVDEPVMLAPMIMSGIVFPFVVMKHESGRGLPLSGMSDEYIEFYIEFILRGLSTGNIRE